MRLDSAELALFIGGAQEEKRNTAVALIARGTVDKADTTHGTMAYTRGYQSRNTSAGTHAIYRNET